MSEAAVATKSLSQFSNAEIAEAVCRIVAESLGRKRDEVGIESPWHMVGAIALGYPEGDAPARGRKPLDRVVTWIEEETR